MFHNSDPGRATIVRRRFYSWRESSSKTRVERQALEWTEEGNCGPEDWGSMGSCLMLKGAWFELEPCRQ